MSSKKKKWVASIVVIFLLLLFVGIWNSPLFYEYRAFKETETSRVSDYGDNSYKNEQLLDIVEYEGFEYYIFEADEYISEVFNSKIYTIVRCDKEFLFLRSFDRVDFLYDYPGGVTLGSGENGTIISGVKELNNFSTMELVLESGETILVDVTDTKVLFYYTKESLDIESYEIVIDE